MATDQMDLLTEPNPEAVERDRVLSDLAAARRGYLEEIREHLRELFEIRQRRYGVEAFVTADDARTFFESTRQPSPPGPDVLSRNFLGAVFKAAGWHTDGQTYHSKTKGSHANRLLRWHYEAPR